MSVDVGLGVGCAVEDGRVVAVGCCLDVAAAVSVGAIADEGVGFSPVRQATSERQQQHESQQRPEARWTRLFEVAYPKPQTHNRMPHGLTSITVPVFCLYTERLHFELALTLTCGRVRRKRGRQALLAWPPFRAPCTTLCPDETGTIRTRTTCAWVSAPASPTRLPC